MNTYIRSISISRNAISLHILHITSVTFLNNLVDIKTIYISCSTYLIEIFAILSVVTPLLVIVIVMLSDYS